jgi:hypothetical protein
VPAILGPAETRSLSFCPKVLPLPRRGALALGVLAVLTSPPTLAAEPTEDILVQKLKERRDALSGCAERLDAGDWDSVRKVIQTVLVYLSTRGYTGESVKSRALEMGDDGKPLVDARRALLVKLGTLDKYLYDLQVNVGPHVDASG